MYSGYGVTFDSAGFWCFYNDSARSFIIFRVDNFLSSHTGNCKKKFLVLEDIPTFGVSGSFGSAEKV